MNPGEKPITLQVENSDTIKTVKEKVEELARIPVSDQAIMFEGRVLQDDCIVSDCDIKSSKLNIKLEIGKKVCTCIHMYVGSYLLMKALIKFRWTLYVHCTYYIRSTIHWQDKTLVDLAVRGQSTTLFC